MYKYIINITIAFVAKANRITLWRNNNTYDLMTFDTNLIIYYKPHASLSVRNKNYQTHASLSGTLHKKGRKTIVDKIGVFLFVQFGLNNGFSKKN